MHVAFFNRSFHPDTAATGQLLTELCEGLVCDHGCRVSVVCGPALQPSGHGAPAPRGLVGRDTYHGVDILRARGTRFPKGRFIGRAANYVSYFLSACYAGLTLDRPDVVVALTDPPIIGLAGWLASRRFGVPLVMAYQDLFPEVARLLEDFQSDAVDTALQRVNRFLCRRAARVVALGETMRQRLIDGKGAAPDRTRIIANWADTRLITPGPKRNAFAEAHGLADKFVVMHSGNLGLSQGLDTIVEAAARLQTIDDLRIVFQGEGVRKQALQDRAAELGLRNVMFLPYQAQAGLSESFAAADLFIVSLKRGLAGYIVPSKLYGILAAGRPYVAAVEDACEVAALTRGRDCGVVTPPGDAAALADAIVTFYRNPQMTARRGASARAASLAFDRQVQVRAYAELLGEVGRQVT